MNRQRPLALALAAAFLLTAAPVQAASVPSNLLYEGRLLDGSRNPVTSAIVFRFSLWKSTDWTVSDGSGGLINVAATNYSGWFESQTISPSSNGIIQAQLGSGTALPILDFALHKYLQVEVKTVGQLDTSYVLLDPTGDAGADAIDRRIIGAVAYAINAESIQSRTIGTSSGNIVPLSPGGKIGAAQMGSGTNALGFKINTGNAVGDATLTFGNAVLPQTVKFSSTNQRFEFSKDVYVTGALGVSGTVSGSTLHAQSLLTASGNSVFGGSARFNGTTILNGVPYTWPASAASASGKVLKVNPVTGQLSWSDDSNTAILQSAADSRYVNTSGDTMTGSLRLANSAGLNASGSLLTNTNITLNSDNEAADAVVTFGNALLAQTLRFSSSRNRFEFSKDVYVTGALGVSGTLSGSTLHAQNRLESSGSLVVNGQATFGSTLRMNGVSYTWPASAASASGKVLKVNPVTGQLSWSDDSNTGILQTAADARYVNTSGDTMTGALNVRGNLSGSSLTVSGLKGCGTLTTDTNGVLSCGGMVTKKKPTNQTVTNSIALVEDSTFQMGSNETWVYRFSMMMLAAGAGPDLRVAVTAPVGSTCQTHAVDIDSATTNNSETSTCGGVLSAITLAANSHTDVEVFGSITTSATSGSGALRWAQSTANASAVTMLSGSTLIAFKTVGSDLAEVYKTDDPSVLPGMVVSLDPRSPGWLTKSRSAYDAKVLGVLSTKPGITIGGDDLQGAKGIPVFLALAGRVPVMVSGENGPIRPGDLLTASSTPGTAMKATKAGPIIGKALSGYGGTGIGVVTVFIQNQSGMNQP